MAIALSGLACAVPRNTPIEEKIVECVVNRSECTEENLTTESGVGCKTFAVVPEFRAKICMDSTKDINTECFNKFCSQPMGVNYGYPSCSATGIDVTGQFTVAGTCQAAPSADTHLTRVVFTQRWRDCHLVQGGQYCETLPTNGNSDNLCFDLSSLGAIPTLQPAGTTRDRSLQLSSVVTNSSDCPLKSGATGALTYGLAARDIGTLSGGGANVTLTSVGGSARGRINCSEGCVSTLDRIEMKLADRTVLGVPVTNIVVTNTQPVSFYGVPDVDSGAYPLPPRGLNLVATAKVAGVDSFFTFQNNGQWRVRITPSDLHVEGPLNLVVSDAAGRPLQISGSLSGDGAITPPGCGSLPPTARIFGFENLQDWRSSAATLSSVTSPTTQGCAALGAAGQGYFSIAGASFSTSGLAVQPALSVDLFVPSHQPNPFWIGAAQMFLSCPSGGVTNQYIGQIELTGKPQDQYSTLRFPLPAVTQSTLRRALNDCAFTFTLNVNPTGRTWIFDNLRFTP